MGRPIVAVASVRRETIRFTLTRQCTETQKAKEIHNSLEHGHSTHLAIGAREQSNHWEHQQEYRDGPQAAWAHQPGLMFFPGY